MINGGLGDDGSIADIPWASVFDPDNNLRALGAVQARGFRAASEVVDRLLKATDQSRDAESRESDGANPDVDRILTMWQHMMGQVARSIRDGVSTPESTGPAAFDLSKAEASGGISIDAAGPGVVADAEVWLHNKGGTDLGKVRLRCSDLLAHDGATIESGAVRFEPDTVPLPPRCSRGVTVQVDVADDVVPGHYRGTLLADGHPDVWLPVALVVRSAVP